MRKGKWRLHANLSKRFRYNKKLKSFDIKFHLFPSIEYSIDTDMFDEGYIESGDLTFSWLYWNLTVYASREVYCDECRYFSKNTGTCKNYCPTRPDNKGCGEFTKKINRGWTL